MANKNKDQEKKVNIKTKSSNWFKEKTQKLIGPAKGIIWSVEAGMRLLVSYLLMTTFHDQLALVAGLYFAVSGILIIVVSIFKANR